MAQLGWSSRGLGFEVREGKCQRSQAGNAYGQEVGEVHSVGVLGGLIISIASLS
jgi:hypothetical protein